MEPIVTAGADAAPQLTLRRELIKQINGVLSRSDATPTEREDALEALVELSKE